MIAVYKLYESMTTSEVSARMNLARQENNGRSIIRKPKDDKRSFMNQLSDQVLGKKLTKKIFKPKPKIKLTTKPKYKPSSNLVAGW